MSERFRPGETARVAMIGEGVRRAWPTRCWAETRAGTRCRNSGTFVMTIPGELVPYAVCGVHARADRYRLWLVAPDWDPVVKAYAERHQRPPVEHR